MLYDLWNEYEANRARKRLEWLIGRRAIAEIADKSRFSASQNNYMHVCIGIVALETGVTLEHAKQKWFKRIVNREMFYAGTFSDPVTGEECGKWRSSSSLTKEEMSLAIERWRNWSSDELGIYIPTQEEHAAIKQAAVEVKKNEKWL